jgi:hypothetical protein
LTGVDRVPAVSGAVLPALAGILSALFIGRPAEMIADDSTPIKDREPVAADT